MTDMSDPVFAAALATKLKEECERQHARAEKAEADIQRLTAEVARLRTVVEAGEQTLQNLSVETDRAAVAIASLSAAILMREALTPLAPRQEEPS